MRLLSASLSSARNFWKLSFAFHFKNHTTILWVYFPWPFFQPRWSHIPLKGIKKHSLTHPAQDFTFLLSSQKNSFASLSILLQNWRPQERKEIPSTCSRGCWRSWPQSLDTSLGSELSEGNLGSSGGSLLQPVAPVAELSGTRNVFCLETHRDC